MQQRIQSYISESRTLLANARNVLKSVRTVSPSDVVDMLHVGVQRAKAIFEMGQQAYGKGVIDRSTLLSAVEVANAWLDFDDDVMDLVAEEFPVAIAPADERLVQ